MAISKKKTKKNRNFNDTCTNTRGPSPLTASTLAQKQRRERERERERERVRCFLAQKWHKKRPPLRLPLRALTSLRGCVPSIFSDRFGDGARELLIQRSNGVCCRKAPESTSLRIGQPSTAGKEHQLSLENDPTPCGETQRSSGCSWRHPGTATTVEDA